jgi:hypothetical protein
LTHRGGREVGHGGHFWALFAGLVTGEGTAQLDADPALKSRVDQTLAWLIEDGASISEALIALLVGLESKGAAIVVVDMVEQGLDQAAQEALIAHLRGRNWLQVPVRGVQRYGRCRCNTGRPADAADTAAPDPDLRSSPGGYPGGGRSRWSSRPGHPRWTTSVPGPGTGWGPRLPRLHPAQKAPIRHHPRVGSLRLATNLLDESQIRASARVVHKHGVRHPST